MGKNQWKQIIQLNNEHNSKYNVIPMENDMHKTKLISNKLKIKYFPSKLY